MQELQAMERFQVGLGMAGASRVLGKRGKLRARKGAGREECQGPCPCDRSACTSDGVGPQLPRTGPRSTSPSAAGALLWHEPVGRPLGVAARVWPTSCER